MENTYKVASEIVSFLQLGFVNNKFNIPTIRNVFITGSFVRGDWLNMSSDLDIQILYHKESQENERKIDLLKLQNAVSERFGNPPFPSQTMEIPTGLEWSQHEYLPVTEQDISTISPFLSYNIFYFDFYKNRKLLHGTDFTNELPQPIDITKTIKPAIEFLTERICNNNQYSNVCRCAYASYKIAVILQIYFGEIEIDKRKMLDLYLKNVPEFSHKHWGEIIIRNYIGSYYPDRKPTFFERYTYIDFAQASLALIESSMRTK